MAVQPAQSQNVTADKAAVDKAPSEVQQEAPGPGQLALREARELAAAAREHEATEKAQELAQGHGLEREGHER
jgi:hypothetical protein